MANSGGSNELIADDMKAASIDAECLTDKIDKDESNEN